MSAVAMSNFPVESNVVLTGLKAKDYNGKTGIVKSSLQENGRQQVLVGKQTLALKPSNLQYVLREVDSLTIQELKTVAVQSNSTNDDDSSPVILTGMDRSELRDKVRTMDPQHVAEILARAKEPKQQQQRSTSSSSMNAPSISQQQVREGADRMSQMSPEEMKRQAQMMRSMDPAMIRRSNPSLAHMTDAQIRMAADQMEMMANNPAMVQMAAQQMRQMSPQQVQQQINNATAASGATTTATTSSSVSTPSATSTTPNITKDQIDNLDANQLKAQAQAMRNADPNMLRSMNPMLAGMTDEQIKVAAAQMEAMASNPGAFDAMKNQVANMSPEQMQEAMQQQQPSATTSSSQPSATGGGIPPNMDPSKMMESMDGKQIKQMMSMLKGNPALLQELTKSNPMMAGMSEEQLSKQLEMFDKMDEKQLDRVLGMARGVNKVAEPAKKAYASVDNVVGGHLAKLMMALGALLIGLLFYYLFFRSTGGDAASTVLNTGAVSQQQEEQVPVMGDASSQSEFDSEF